MNPKVIGMIIGICIICSSIIVIVAYYLTQSSTTPTPKATGTGATGTGATGTSTGGTTPPVTPSVAPTVPVASFKPLKSKLRDNFCLDVPGGNKDNDVELIGWGCNSQTNQSWKLDDKRRLVNENSGSCVHTKGAGADNGTPLVQYTCGDGTNQLWTMKGNGQLSPDNAPTKCMNIAGANTADGAKIILWDCVEDVKNDKWFFG